MNPSAKSTFPSLLLTLHVFVFRLNGIEKSLFFTLFIFYFITMQHEMQHEKIQWIFVFWHRTNKNICIIPTLAQIIPKSSQFKRFIISFLSPGSSDISDALGHFRTNMLSKRPILLSNCCILSVFDDF